MLIKICGIKTKNAALVATESGANLIGFVFAPSTRRITPRNAQSIVEVLPRSVKTVGVFVNETVENMHEIAKTVGLDYIQLHGDEDAAIAKQLNYKVIKAFPVDKETLATIQDFPCDYYILDSPIGDNRGGNGTTFDWDLAKDLSIDRNKIILAGGLDAFNVAEAIDRVKPAGVDISSGVETNGVKDHQKIKEFIASVRNI